MLTREVPTVAQALHHARGCPDLPRPAPFTPGGACGRCGDARETAPAKKVLSAQFGSWEEITPHAGARWLCLPCASTYRADDLRRRASIITTDHALTRPSIAQLRAFLNKPIPLNTAVIVPLAGKRLVAPAARWGSLSTDTGVLEWTRGLHQATTYAHRLRLMGFGDSHLAEGSPSYSVLISLPVTQHPEVTRMWRVLGHYRSCKSRWPLISFLSRKA